MKKILVLILCIGLVFPICASAANCATIGFDNASYKGDSVILPMYISDIPHGLNNISAITIHFTFDTSVLEFVELTDGSISSISSWYNHSKKNPNKVIVSWYDASSSNENALTEANVGKSSPVFYAKFKIIGELTEPSWIDFETVSVHDYSSNKADNIVTKSGVICMYNIATIENPYGLSGKSLVQIKGVPEGVVPMADGFGLTYFGKGTFAAVVDDDYALEFLTVDDMPSVAEFGMLHENGVTAWDALVTNDEALEKDVSVFDDTQMYVIADIDGNGRIEAIDALNINKISLFNGDIPVPTWVD